MSASRARILLIQPGLHGPGGGDGVAAWMVQALSPHYRLTVATWEVVEPERVNRYFGTSLREADVEWLVIPRRRRLWVDAIPFRHGLLRASVLLRWAQEQEGPYDLRICALCEAALGQPGLQYVHIPWTVEPWSDVHPMWYQPPFSWLRRLYTAGCKRLARSSSDAIGGNRTLVNSDWTGRIWATTYATQAHTVYPPVFVPSPALPEWEQRQDGFVCVGRLAEDKRVEMVIAVIEQARRRYPDLQLHVVGSADSPGYAERIHRMGEERPWLTLYENLTRSELAKLFSRNRYGIHGKASEHFGMGIAEMVRAGCLVFVPDDGGQVEIVGGEPALLYHTPEQAAERILEVMADPLLQSRLRQALRKHSEQFDAQLFQDALRGHVESCLVR